MVLFGTFAPYLRVSLSLLVSSPPDVDGPGPEVPGPVGVWIVADTLSDWGLNMPVNEPALEFSVWPDASILDAAVTMAEGGAVEARRCAC